MMNARVQTQAAPKSLSTPARGGLLQRKCSCGGAAGLSGSCEGCEKKQLQLRTSNQSKRESVPHVVHDVVNGNGQPLDQSTSSFMESRFGHDFSHVRVHTDARAADSANAVNAMAYTVGRNIVFANGQYSPSTAIGKELIAHELTHVIQQQRLGEPLPGHLVLDTSQDQTEQEAQQVASGIAYRNNIRASAKPNASLQRQSKTPAPAQPSPKKPVKTTEPAKKTYPVENCPFPSDFENPNLAGRNMMCVLNEAYEKALECNLTVEHFNLINAAKESARKRVEKAERRMHWLGGPEYAQRIAGYIFKDTSPDVKTIKETLAKTVKIISGGSMKFRGATCADPLCESEGQHAVAYESGPTEPVAFCPRSFLPAYLPEMSSTVVHEAVHLAGIDIDPDIKERYCASKSCEEACQDATSADAWARFIDCLGGPLIKPKVETK